MDRDAMMEEVGRSLLKRGVGHPLRVCIDGPDGAGKTVFADELAEWIKSRGRTVIRASIDGFHRPRAERFARYGESPKGYYHDSFDYPAVRSSLLEHLGPGGDLWYRTATFDFRSDARVEEPWERAEADAFLIFDGVFLVRPELRDLWDFGVYLTVGWDVLLQRVVQRDSSWMGARDDVRERYVRRYIPGQKLYLQEGSPREVADVVIDNSSFVAPRIVKGLPD